MVRHLKHEANNNLGTIKTNMSACAHTSSETRNGGIGNALEFVVKLAAQLIRNFTDSSLKAKFSHRHRTLWVLACYQIAIAYGCLRPVVTN